ncbi:hypothetical protein P7K49_013671 [Saguinus oedipus]|uniref:Uncharacterized protein n=1 Tax=Saguinus oedipus TaxID=9490 RepID=A0ABQ9VGK8_SAGOE|nr:hypothetical protein P7K49_013671 [Saguinus oedipus]
MDLSGCICRKVPEECLGQLEAQLQQMLPQNALEGLSSMLWRSNPGLANMPALDHLFLSRLLRQQLEPPENSQ